jgi:uncharacterized protein YwqG
MRGFLNLRYSIDPKMTLRESLLSKLNASDLAPIASQLVDLSKESFRLHPSPVEDRLLHVGASKLGGWPDLPAAFAWPEWKNGPLAFVAQINLQEIPANDLLPGAGLLSFFYDAEQSAWGFDPKDAEGFRTYFFTDTPALIRLSQPFRPKPVTVAQRLRSLFGGKSQQLSQYSSCRLSFDPFLSLPEQAATAMEDLLSQLEDEQSYASFLESYLGPEPQHQLLGLAQPVQGEMELECQLVTNGLYTGNPSGYRDPRRKTLEGGAIDWMLLLQVDSDDSAGMMWGDLGMLYFWIRRQDLASLNFDKVWTVLQCH